MIVVARHWRLFKILLALDQGHMQKFGEGSLVGIESRLSLIKIVTRLFEAVRELRLEHGFPVFNEENAIGTLAVLLEGTGEWIDVEALRPRPAMTGEQLGELLR